MNADRANAMIYLAMQRLGNRFSFCSYDKNPQNWIFGIAEKAKPGEFFDDVQERQLDGTVRKLRIKNHGGVTLQQMVVIETTSSSVEEGADRIIDLVIHKNDTTRLVPQSKVAGLTVDQVRDLIAAAIAEDRKLRTEQEQKVEAVIEQVVQKQREIEVEEPPLTGLQQKPKRSAKAMTAAKRKHVALWQERARLMGEPPPMLTTVGHIDKRWIRFAEPRWNDYCSKQQVTLTPASLVPEEAKV